MTYDERVEGVALLDTLGRALGKANVKKGSDLVRITLALERLAQFFGAELEMNAS